MPQASFRMIAGELRKLGNMAGGCSPNVEQQAARSQTVTAQDDAVQEERGYVEVRQDYTVPIKPGHGDEGQNADLSSARPLSAGTSYSFDDTEEGQEIARLTHSNVERNEESNTHDSASTMKVTPSRRPATKARTTLRGNFKVRDLQSSKTNTSPRHVQTSARKTFQPAKIANNAVTQPFHERALPGSSMHIDSNRKESMPLHSVRSSRIGKRQYEQVRRTRESWTGAAFDSIVAICSERATTRQVDLTPSRPCLPKKVPETAHATLTTLADGSVDQDISLSLQHDLDDNANSTDIHGEAPQTEQHLKEVSERVQPHGPIVETEVQQTDDDSNKGRGSDQSMPSISIPLHAHASADTRSAALLDPVEQTTVTSETESAQRSPHNDTSRSDHHSLRSTAAQKNAHASPSIAPSVVLGPNTNPQDSDSSTLVNAPFFKTAKQHRSPHGHHATLEGETPRPIIPTITVSNIENPESPAVNGNFARVEHVKQAPTPKLNPSPPQNQRLSDHALANMIVQKVRRESLVSSEKVRAEHDRCLSTMNKAMQDLVQTVELRTANIPTKVVIESAPMRQDTGSTHEIQEAIQQLEKQLENAVKRMEQTTQTNVSSHLTQRFESLLDRLEQQTAARDTVAVAAPPNDKVTNGCSDKYTKEEIAKNLRDIMAPVVAEALAHRGPAQNQASQDSRQQQEASMISRVLQGIGFGPNKPIPGSSDTEIMHDLKSQLQKLQQDKNGLQAEYEAKLKASGEEQRKLAVRSLADEIERFNKTSAAQQKETDRLIQERESLAQELKAAIDLQAAIRAELAKAGQTNAGPERHVDGQVEAARSALQKKVEEMNVRDLSAWALEEDFPRAELKSLLDDICAENATSVAEVKNQDELIEKCQAMLRVKDQIQSDMAPAQTPTQTAQTEPSRARARVDRRTNTITQAPRTQVTASQLLSQNTHAEDELLVEETEFIRNERPISASSALSELLEPSNQFATPPSGQGDHFNSQIPRQVSQVQEAGGLFEEEPQPRPSPAAPRNDSQVSMIDSFGTSPLQEFLRSEHRSLRGDAENTTTALLHSSRAIRQPVRPNSSSKRVCQGSPLIYNPGRNQQVEVFHSSPFLRPASVQSSNLAGPGTAIPSTPHGASQKRILAYAPSPTAKRMAVPSSPVPSTVARSPQRPVSRPVSGVADLPKPPQHNKPSRKLGVPRKAKVVTNELSQHVTRSMSAGQSETFYKLHY